MDKFTQIHAGQSCAECGKELKIGAVVYAAHADAVRAGAGLCAKCAKAQSVEAEQDDQVEETAVDETTQSVEADDEPEQADKPARKRGK